MGKPICPRCGEATIRIHCDSHSSPCTWVRCRSCSMTMDLLTKRAFDREGTVNLAE